MKFARQTVEGTVIELWLIDKLLTQYGYTLQDTPAQLVALILERDRQLCTTGIYNRDECIDVAKTTIRKLLVEIPR